MPRGLPHVFTRDRVEMVLFCFRREHCHSFPLRHIQCACMRILYDTGAHDECFMVPGYRFAKFVCCGAVYTRIHEQTLGMRWPCCQTGTSCIQQRSDPVVAHLVCDPWLWEKNRGGRRCCWASCTYIDLIPRRRGPCTYHVECIGLCQEKDK